MFINDSSKYTLQVLLRQLIFESESAVSSHSALNNFKMAVMIMTMLPVIILYPFIQKHFISGIMLGSIKG
jgi:putative aldouronate transport system permease protein